MYYTKLGKQNPEHDPKSLFKNTNGNLENTPSMLRKTQPLSLSSIQTQPLG